MSLYSDLRNKYPVFNYNGYKIEINDGICNIEYSFEIEGLSQFNPCWVLPVNPKYATDNGVFESIVFNLGMTELVSYWKLTCSPTVNIKCAYISDEQAHWWKKLYYNGLGECFYLNGISDSIDNFMNINCLGKKVFASSDEIPADGCLIPIGGGKDSVVTLNLASDKNTYCYIINPRGATTDTVKVAGYEDRTIIASRSLDKRMLELNKQEFINGHTPFSAVVAFSALAASYANGIKYIALSNESSANESTVVDSYVNHQYSKSFEFEKDFNDYEQEFIKSSVRYFSFLRPLSEYQIAQLFSKYTDFYSIFKSCNAGSKQNIWCCNCPKCLFVYIIMSPFIEPDALKNIFGENLLEKEELRESFDKLTGILPEKPFECVGERDEINFALCEAIKKYDNLPLLLKYYMETEQYKNYSKRENPYNNYYDDNNLLPKKYEDILKKALQEV